MRLADTAAIAFFTRRAPSTIRNWARRYPDRLPRRGRDKRGRTLYSVEDAEQLAATMTTPKPDVEITGQRVRHFDRP
jgi:hypothetical protein